MTPTPSPSEHPAPATPTGARRWLRPMPLIRLAFVVAVVVLGLVAVARDGQGFLDAVGEVGLARGAGAFVLVGLGLWVSAGVWRLAVTAIAGPLPVRAARSVFFVSQLGKYLPGGVWSIAAQVDLARRHGLRRTSMGVGALLFLAFHLATGLVLAAVLVAVGAPEVVEGRWWLVAAVGLAGLIGLAPGVLRWGSDLLLRITRREHPPVTLTGRQVVRASAMMLVVWVCYGLATAVVAGPLRDGGVGTAQLLAATTGGFALAWIVGILFIPAPAGVGAREVAFVAILSPLTGVTAATSLAILLRVLHTLADLVLAAWAASLHRRRSET